MKTDIAENVGKHAFEVAGLGLAPFRFVGFTINKITYPDGSSKAGGTCAYCGTGIMNECLIRSHDGKVSKVGCDCIRKVDDEGLLKAYANSAEVRAHKRQLEAAKAKAVRDEAVALIEANKATLAAQPHPKGFTRWMGRDEARQPMTRLDDVMFWLHSGRKGAMAVLKQLRSEFGKQLMA